MPRLRFDVDIRPTMLLAIHRERTVVGNVPRLKHDIEPFRFAVRERQAGRDEKESVRIFAGGSVRLLRFGAICAARVTDDRKVALGIVVNPDNGRRIRVPYPTNHKVGQTLDRLRSLGRIRLETRAYPTRAEHAIRIDRVRLFPNLKADIARAVAMREREDIASALTNHLFCSGDRSGLVAVRREEGKPSPAALV